VQIEVYTNPSSPTSAGIVKAVVDEFISRVEEGRTSQVESSAITLKTNIEGADAVAPDLLSYFAPGIALMFLMYTVSYGGRSILAERAEGTLPRLMVSPTRTAQVLGGKVLGIFFMGVAQVGILILASTLFFQVRWGDALGVIVLILAAVSRCNRLGIADHGLCPYTCTGCQYRHHCHVDLQHFGR
jgi:ABC-type Na+ efflux pump permease subunit